MVCWDYDWPWQHYLPCGNHHSHHSSPDCPYRYICNPQVRNQYDNIEYEPPMNNAYISFACPVFIRIFLGYQIMKRRAYFKSTFFFYWHYIIQENNKIMSDILHKNTRLNNYVIFELHSCNLLRTVGSNPFRGVGKTKVLHFSN